MVNLSEFIGKRYYHKIVIEAGEQNKCLSTVEDIWGALISHGATREALLVNLGGGMVTDIGGFAAATYMRGIRFVNIPTTLLAMVDASSGGKTGIDYAGVKNVIGCFSSAKDTLIYPSFLRTLPNKELLSGFAEMLKHALISSNDEWVKLLGIVEDGLAGEELVEYLHHSGVLEASIAIKERIVKEDPREQGLRKILNFGHTVGHAIEALSLENTIQPHGYCVMWGMVAEVYLSVVHKACPREVLQYLTQIMLQLYGRPQCDCKQRDELVNKMYQDKKNSANYYKWSDGISRPFGYFVTFVPNDLTITICDGSDIFGVTIEDAAFVGGQDALVPRDGTYGLVATFGVVDVRCAAGIAVGDYVVSDENGIAVYDGLRVYTADGEAILYRVTETKTLDSASLMPDHIWEGDIVAERNGELQFEVILGVVNSPILELPETGSNALALMPIGLMLCAAVCMG